MDWLNDEYPSDFGKLTPKQLNQVDAFVEANLIQSAEAVQCYIQEQFHFSCTVDRPDPRGPKPLLDTPLPGLRRNEVKRPDV
jgi:hypothetical protein